MVTIPTRLLNRNPEAQRGTAKHCSNRFDAVVACCAACGWDECVLLHAAHMPESGAVLGSPKTDAWP